MLQIVCAERYFFMASILPNTDSLQLGRSYKARLCLISGGSPAPPIQPFPLPTLGLFGSLNSFYKFPANLLLRRPSYNYCSSRSHRTTTAAPEAIAQLLQLPKPSHNYCCSGGHRTTSAPAAIAPASSSSPISDSTSKFATSSLNATVPTSRSWLGGRYSFLWRTRLVRPPTEISLISVRGQRKTTSQFLLGGISVFWGP